MLTHVLPSRATEKKGGVGRSGVGEQSRNWQGVGGEQRDSKDTSETPLLNTSLSIFL
jgi:hypothetical protein